MFVVMFPEIRRKYWDNLPSSTGEFAGFLNHQQYPQGPAPVDWTTLQTAWDEGVLVDSQLPGTIQLETKQKKSGKKLPPNHGFGNKFIQARDLPKIDEVRFWGIFFFKDVFLKKNSKLPSPQKSKVNFVQWKVFKQRHSFKKKIGDTAHLQSLLSRTSIWPSSSCSLSHRVGSDFQSAKALLIFRGLERDLPESGVEFCSGALVVHLKLGPVFVF